MVLAIGKFQVSKYAAPGGVAAGGVGTGLDFGLGTVGGNQFGGGGTGQLIPSNVFPSLIGPGGEIMPGGGGTPLPGGVSLEDPAYAGHPGPFWDPTSNGGVFGTDVFKQGPSKTFGSRILNVNLPKMISAGQAFAIIVTYLHQGDAFTTYKVKVNIPILQVMETSQEKRVANGGQDNVVINLTAPAPLPNGVITGTVELVQTEGNEVTVDSEIITIPSEVVPNPPMPIPPDAPPIPIPMPMPEPSPPPTAPPVPPVPLPPVLQQIPVTITRGEEAGLPTIIIEASNLEASEPCTLFVYLSHRGNRGHHYGWRNRDWRDGRDGRGNDNDNDRDHDRGDWDRGDREKWISKQTPAGSTAISNIAYSYPASVSINGITSAGNGLRLTNMPTVSSIQNQVRSQMQSSTSRTSRLSSLQSTIRNRVSSALAARGISTAIANIAAHAAANTAVATAGNATASATAAGQAAVAAAVAGGASAQASAIGNVAAATAGQAVAVAVASIAVGEPNPSGPIIDPRQLPRPVFKRQKVSLTATEAGTIRHVVRIQSAPITAKLNGYVIVYGHRTKRHSGRKPFSL